MSTDTLKYVASWEHLHLVGNPISGLPNNLFSINAWSLILFDELYCDEAAYQMELSAVDQMGWTNSRQFKIASQEGIINTIKVSAFAARELDSIQDELNEDGHQSPHSYLETLSDDDLHLLRQRIINSATSKAKVFVLDYFNAPTGGVIPKIFHSESGANLPASSIRITKDLWSLPPQVRVAFERTQQHENRGTASARRGSMTQREWFDFLEPLRPDYHHVDNFLKEGTSENWSKLLRVREKFGRRNGWTLVNNFISLYLAEDTHLFSAEGPRLRRQIEATIAEAQTLTGEDLLIGSRQLFRAAAPFNPLHEYANWVGALKSIGSHGKSLGRDIASYLQQKRIGLIRRS